MVEQASASEPSDPMVEQASASEPSDPMVEQASASEPSSRPPHLPVGGDHSSPCRAG